MLFASCNRLSREASQTSSNSCARMASRTAVMLAKSETDVYAPAGRTARVVSSPLAASKSRMADRSGLSTGCSLSRTRSSRPARSVKAISSRLVASRPAIATASACFDGSSIVTDRKIVESKPSRAELAGASSTRYSRIPNTTRSPTASAPVFFRARLMKTPLVLPRSSTSRPPSPVMLTVACNRDRLGSSMTTSACADRPIVFVSPHSRKIDGKCGTSAAGRRQALVTRLLQSLIEAYVDLGAEQHGPVVVERRPFHQGGDARLDAPVEHRAPVGDDGDRLREVEGVGRRQQRELGNPSRRGAHRVALAHEVDAPRGPAAREQRH